MCCLLFSPEYNVNFFKQFSLVMNALDNKSNSTHVHVSHVSYLSHVTHKWCAESKNVLLFWKSHFLPSVCALSILTNLPYCVYNIVWFAAARNHVNRLCLAAGVTLVESGSAGYLGQVSVIRKVRVQLSTGPVVAYMYISVAAFMHDHMHTPWFTGNFIYHVLLDNWPQCLYDTLVRVSAGVV